jgi:hypothetical protein
MSTYITRQEENCVTRLQETLHGNERARQGEQWTEESPESGQVDVKPRKIEETKTFRDPGFVSLI